MKLNGSRYESPLRKKKKKEEATLDELTSLFWIRRSYGTVSIF
jgi:hypothetical protein